MLALTRRVNESIVINNETTITIVSVKGDKVKLGCEAPPHVVIHRREIQDIINRKAITATINLQESAA